MQIDLNEKNNIRIKKIYNKMKRAKSEDNFYQRRNRNEFKEIDRNYKLKFLEEYFSAQYYPEKVMASYIF